MSKYGGKIRDSVDALNKKRKEIDNAQLEFMHACPHTYDGDPRSLTVIKNGNVATLKCERCGKNDITMTPPTPAEFAAACKVIENGIDYIKLQQRETDDDRKSYELDMDDVDKINGFTCLKRCKIALDLLTFMNKYYEALNFKNGKKKKRDDRENKRTAFALASRSVLDSYR